MNDGGEKGSVGRARSDWLPLDDVISAVTRCTHS